MFLRLLYPIHIEKSIERNGNFLTRPGDAFSIPQRGERILSIRAQEGGGTVTALRAQDGRMAAEKIPACSSARKVGRMFGSRRKRSDVDRSSSACSAPPRRSPRRFPESFVPPAGVWTAGDLRPPASRLCRSRSENRLFWPENMEIAVKNI